MASPTGITAAKRFVPRLRGTRTPEAHPAIVTESGQEVQGLLVSDIHDPKLSPLYREVLAHDGTVAMSSRVQHPDRKGRV